MIIRIEVDMEDDDYFQELSTHDAVFFAYLTYIAELMEIPLNIIGTLGYNTHRLHGSPEDPKGVGSFKLTLIKKWLPINIRL